MLTKSWLCTVLVGLLSLVSVSAVASPERDSANAAVVWLTSHQNGDGSWGSSSDVRPVYTAVVVEGLRTFNQRGAAYYAGIAWLENHAMGSVDYRARRMIALFHHGDDLSRDVTSLSESFSDPTGFGLLSNLRGWGLSKDYRASPRDTGLVLRAYGVTGKGNTTEIKKAIGYLAKAQFAAPASRMGSWPVGSGIVGDVSTTAEVMRAYSLHVDPDPNVKEGLAFESEIAVGLIDCIKHGVWSQPDRRAVCQHMSFCLGPCGEKQFSGILLQPRVDADGRNQASRSSSDPAYSG